MNGLIFSVNERPRNKGFFRQIPKGLNLAGTDLVPTHFIEILDNIKWQEVPGAGLASCSPCLEELDWTTMYLPSLPV